MHLLLAGLIHVAAVIGVAEPQPYVGREILPWLMVFNEEAIMKLSCDRWCHIQEFLANLKCPRCFSAKPRLCKEETDKKTESHGCECEIQFAPDIGLRWE